MNFSRWPAACRLLIQRSLRRFMLSAVILPSFLLGLAHASLAQTEVASVSGTIVDRQGGLVPGVEVVVVNTDTNEKYATKTNSAGVYNVPSVKPGHYRILVTKPGFKQIDLRDITLNVQDSVNRNFALDLGGVSETVIVNAGDALNINTTDASVSTVVDQTYVKNMPLNGRSFQDLILLTPGILTQTPQSSGNGGIGQTGEFTVNGQRTESNYYTVDGVSANVGTASGFNMTQASGASGSVPGATALGTTQALVSVDALQEFRVQSSTYSAEYGRNPGGQFALETKSGANQWHGTAYDYLRNGYFDAQDWFSNYFGLPQPAIRQNDFGGTLGGPVRIPALYNGKDKTFFFVSFEGLRLTAPQPASVNFVPDAALRSSAAPALQQVLNAWPVQSPNGIDDTANGIAQYIATWSNPSSLNSTSVRFDHVLNDKVRMFFRFSNTTSSSAFRGPAASEQAPTDNQISAYTMRTYTAGVVSVISNRLTNDFRLNYSSNKVIGRSVIDTLGGSTPVNMLQLSGLSAGALADFFLAPGPYFLDLNQIQTSGAQRQWNLVDTVNLSFGRHQVKFGLDYRRLAPFGTPASPLVAYTYSDIPSIQMNSAQNVDVRATAPAYPLYTSFSAFAQEEWRASRRLSLSLGLRWEVNPAPDVTQGLRPYTVQGSSPATWVLAPQGMPLWQTTWYNFAPRLGAAYVLRSAPGWETVVRGGGGVFFDTGQQTGSSGFAGPGFRADAFLSATFPVDVPPLVPVIVNPPVTKSFQVWAFSPHLQLPYTLEWNGSLEQALGRSQAFTVSYVGSHAGRLLREDLIRPPTNPQFTVVQFSDNGLTSDYDALQLQFRRRLSRGLTALASYAWSHCLDYGSLNFDFGYQRGNCAFDVRHNFSAAFSYDLPHVGQASLAKAVLHGWGLDGRFTSRTAFPVTLNGRRLRDVNGRSYNAGFNLIPGQPIYLYGSNCDSVLQALGKLAPGMGCPGGRAINPQAFANVSTGLGNAPRNFARGFGAWQMNLAIRRDFPIREGLKLQFRTEAFNIFNHPNFGFVNSNVGQSTFGQATTTLAGSLGVLNPLYQQGGSRSLQFALKLIF